MLFSRLGADGPSAPFRASAAPPLLDVLASPHAATRETAEGLGKVLSFEVFLRRALMDVEQQRDLGEARVRDELAAQQHWKLDRLAELDSELAP